MTAQNKGELRGSPTPSQPCRIYAATAARLAAAKTDQEARDIIVGSMAANAESLAETLFARVAGEPFPDWQVNTLVLENLDELRRSVIESFGRIGITEGAYLGRCLEAVTSGFLGRSEALFSTGSGGGTA